MSEFDLITKYFSQQQVKRSDVLLGIGDDAALTDVTHIQQLAISIDTLIAGVHFPAETAAYDIGWKALAVNLSDMAAMGAEPLWFTLALTLPEANEKWLSGFSAGLFDLAEQYNVTLIGGDTTKGALSITLQIAGKYLSSPHMQRANAQVGDQIYVSGLLGDAAMGLMALNQPLAISADENQQLLNKLNRPQPRVNEALILCPLINAAIDISDGLYADLSHILSASDVGAELNVNCVPVSSLYRWLNQGENNYDVALTGGDDYELCMTVPIKHEAMFIAKAEALNCPVTKIGEIMAGDALRLLTHNQKEYQINKTAYDHFKPEVKVTV